MSVPVGTAAAEEQAELENLRAEADRSTAEVAQTLAELTGRLTARHQKEVAKRLALTAIPVLFVAATVAYFAVRSRRARV